MPQSRHPAPASADLLHNPHLNRGSAYPLPDRRALRIEGLLPPVADTLEIQIARVHAQLAGLDNDLQKYLFLTDLQSRNEVLFYAVLMSDPAAFMPLVYTPTVGEACQSATIFSAPRAACICRSARGGECTNCSPTGRTRTYALSWRRTANASSASATSASAAWASPWASWRSIPPVPGCRRS